MRKSLPSPPFSKAENKFAKPLNGSRMSPLLLYSERFISERGCPQNLSALYVTIDGEERVLEFVLIHRQLGPVPLEMLKKYIETAKEFDAEPSKFVPGGKLIAAYKACGQSVVVCIWEAPTVEALVPMLEQMNFMEWETEVIPAEKMAAFIPKAEEILAQMAEG